MSNLNSRPSDSAISSVPAIRNPQVESDELWLAVRDLRELLQGPGRPQVRR
jgi:hypothetical protein